MRWRCCWLPIVLAVPLAAQFGSGNSGLSTASGGGAEVNDLETTDPPNQEANEAYIGTGSGAGAWTAAPVLGTSVGAPFFVSGDADPADAGAVRLGNTEIIGWELATPGTDMTFGVNSSDQFAFNDGDNLLLIDGNEYLFHNAKATTGQTKLTIKLGAGDGGGDHILSFENNAGAEQAFFRNSGQHWESINSSLNLVADGGIGSDGFHDFSYSQSFAPTSADRFGIRQTTTFDPASGTATFAALKLLLTVNQTGGASGISRGLFIDPTITAASDFRAIEVAQGRIVAPGITAAEDYKAGLAIVLGGDTAHDINAAAGIAQSNSLSQNIIFAAQAGKQLDVKWAAGASDGMLGMPDLTSAIVLTFSLSATPDTITAGSGTPFAGCNDGGTETGTIIIQGGDTNNGTFEVASCTDTVLTLGNGVLSGDETGDSGEYESRYVQPDTWYHVFLIESAGTEDICADTSEIATNCLSESSYDQWRLLQSILTNGTANLVSF